jgi:hypothetical protein
MVKEAEEKVQKNIHNMKKAQARQKGYADKRRIEREMCPWAISKYFGD